MQDSDAFQWNYISSIAIFFYIIIIIGLPHYIYYIPTLAYTVEFWSSSLYLHESLIYIFIYVVYLFKNHNRFRDRKYNKIIWIDDITTGGICLWPVILFKCSILHRWALRNEKNLFSCRRLDGELSFVIWLCCDLRVPRNIISSGWHSNSVAVATSFHIDVLYRSFDHIYTHFHAKRKIALRKNHVAWRRPYTTNVCNSKVLCTMDFI